MSGMRGLVAGVLLGLLLVQQAASKTNPGQRELLEEFKAAMLARPQHTNWTKALASWTCPPQTGSCDDICGDGPWSVWEHVGCRGPRLSFAKYGEGTGDVTNIHITDYSIEGPVPIKELCPFSALREFDIDGGKLVGSIPTEFAECFPELTEIDLSYNQLSGELPKEIALIKKLEQLKIEVNQVEGGIPEELGNLDRLEWLRFGKNRMSGKVPESFRKMAPRLTQLTLNDNDFEGNLYALSDHHLANVGTQNNPKLCGMVPLSVRYAHGYNPHNTGLGMPCPEELVNGLA